MVRYLGYLLVLLIILWGALAFYTTSKSLAHTASFGGMSLKLDYATDEVSRERGLGGRADVPDGYGMLFVFQKSDYYGFWMKDMLVPIDIFWLDDQYHVVSITADVATSTYPDVFYPSAPARYVLETRAGFGALHGIATGTPLVIK